LFTVQFDLDRGLVIACLDVIGDVTGTTDHSRMTGKAQTNGTNDR
jgi:hypothetical protein